jgi:hypothetical protein
MPQSSSAASSPGARPSSRLVTGMNARWRALPASHRRAYGAITGGFVAFLLFVGLLPLARGTWVAALSAPVGALLGWGAPTALLGMLVTCGLIIGEAFTGTTRPHARASWCLGLALVLLLAASRLLLGGATGGMLGALGAHLLARCAPPVQQLILWGGLALDLLVLFRVSWRDLSRLFANTPSAKPATIPQSANNQSGDAHAVSFGSQPAYAAPEQQRSDLLDALHTGRGWSGQGFALNDMSASLAPDPLVEMRAALSPAGAPVAPPPLDFSGDALLDALRVPAYLRQGMTLDGAQPALPALPAAGAFALPPLPGAAPPPAPPHLRWRGESIQPAIRREHGDQPRKVISPSPSKTGRGPGGGAWALPPLHLLHPAPEAAGVNLRAHATKLAELLARTLKSLGVEAEVRPSDISIGPTVIRFGVRPLERLRTDERGRVQVDADGTPIVVRTRVSRIMNLKDDLALALAVKTLRMEAPVPERPYVGIEIPNAYARTVTLREILASREFRAEADRAPLAVALGRDVAGRVRVGDLARCPHMLIAGATGAGKSVCLNAIIGSLITQATPDDVRLLMIDPKMVELTPYAGLPHLLTPVITDPRAAAAALEAAIEEMERRYRLFAHLGVRNIDGYDARRAADHAGQLERLPRIVIIIDELADLMLLAADAVERAICRLAQLARATGMHLVVATQRPSVDVITGLIKANIPTRIAFMVASAVDSRTILDHGGAEHLLGKGDMLFQPGDAPAAERIQGAFIADDEVARLVAFWAAQGTPPAQWSLPAPAADRYHDPEAQNNLAHLWSRPQREIPARERRS